METFEQMMKRHRKEQGDLMIKQVTSWNDLRSEYGENVPMAVSMEWENRYGSGAQKSLYAQQDAEREAHPEDPRSYRYLNETEADVQEAINDKISMEAFQQYQRDQEEKARREAEALNQPTNEDQEHEKKKTVIEQMAEARAKKNKEKTPGGFEP